MLTLADMSVFIYRGQSNNFSRNFLSAFYSMVPHVEIWLGFSLTVYKIFRGHTACWEGKCSFLCGLPVGCITGLTRPSVLYGLVTRKQKNRKIENGICVPHCMSKFIANFQWSEVKVTGVKSTKLASCLLTGGQSSADCKLGLHHC